MKRNFTQEKHIQESFEGEVHSVKLPLNKHFIQCCKICTLPSPDLLDEKGVCIFCRMEFSNEL